MFGKLSSAVLLACMSACSSAPEDLNSRNRPGIPTSAVNLDRSDVGLKINEVYLGDGGTGDSGGILKPWVELINDGDRVLRLGDFLLVTDHLVWRMPDVHLPPGSLYVLQNLDNFEAAGSEFLWAGAKEVSIVTKQGRFETDWVSIPGSNAGESLARFPNGSGRFYVYPKEKVTFQKQNPDNGFINKLASSTAFKARDSSPNAILMYDGYLWILGGWSNFGQENYHSYTDVWRSVDGIKWELVNSSPPYVHYCSFVVWKGRMWAIGPSSFSSSDGVSWRPEKIQSSELNRSVVMNEVLFNIEGGVVRSTDDGVSWKTLTDNAPWGGWREKPLALVYRDKIWVLGGVANYNTAGETFFNDVWVSGDGTHWQLVNANPQWTPRIWGSAVVYDDKIFLLNGFNRSYWSGDWGNTSEVWFTEDGIDWFELKTENHWSARHASFSVVDSQGNLLVLAGYGNGGVTRMYNDVWSLRASIFFSKPSGALHDLSTWGKNKDGSGATPRSFADDHQIFILRNRTEFYPDERLAITGAGSRILVGDGKKDHLAKLEIADR